MKTFKELKSNGEINGRLYSLAMRMLKSMCTCKQKGYYAPRNCKGCSICENFTVAEFLEMFSEEEILAFRGFGQGYLNELKGLA